MKPVLRACSTRLAWLALLAALVLPSPAQAQNEGEPPPTFAVLEAAGARIGEIRIQAREIFDTDDPKEDKLLFRWANALHIQTRTGVIERALLFKTGEPVSVRLIEETESVLRSTRYLYDVQIRPLAYHGGVVDIGVETRDTWTLDPGVSAGRSGGANTSGIKLNEYNLLGSGVAISYGRSNGVDRSGNEFQFPTSARSAAGPRWATAGRATATGSAMWCRSRTRSTRWIRPGRPACRFPGTTVSTRSTTPATW